MAYVENAALVPLTAKTESGSAVSGLNFGGSTQVVLHVNVTEKTSGTLYVYLEDSLDGVEWFPVDQISIGGAGRHALRTKNPFSDTLRVRWQMATGMSAAFGVALAAF